MGANNSDGITQTYYHATQNCPIPWEDIHEGECGTKRARTLQSYQADPGKQIVELIFEDSRLASVVDDDEP